MKLRYYEDGKLQYFTTSYNNEMRSTGYFDMQGREIYEKDILQVKNLVTQKIEYVLIGWSKESEGWNFMKYRKGGFYYNVVGTLFTHKELLK